MRKCLQLTVSVSISPRDLEAHLLPGVQSGTYGLASLPDPLKAILNWTSVASPIILVGGCLATNLMVHLVPQGSVWNGNRLSKALETNGIANEANSRGKVGRWYPKTGQRNHPRSEDLDGIPCPFRQTGP